MAVCFLLAAEAQVLVDSLQQMLAVGVRAVLQPPGVTAPAALAVPAPFLSATVVLAQSVPATRLLSATALAVLVRRQQARSDLQAAMCKP